MSVNNNPETAERILRYMDDALQRVTKWRTFFTGWHYGTMAKGNPTADAMRNLEEARILLRVEVNALTGILLKKGVFTDLEWAEQLAIEAEAQELAYEKAYPGIKASLNGLDMKLPEAAETMKRMNFRP